MSEWFETQDGILDEVWRQLTRGVADAKAPARHPVLATVSTDGLPEARTVVLRAAERSAARIEIHTDLNSAKVAALRHQPMAALHVWAPKPHVQIRLAARMTIRTGDEVDRIWAAIPEASRGNYGVTPAPGTPIADDRAFARAPDRSAFAVLDGQIQWIEALHLGRDLHRRVLYRADAGWSGQWLAP